MSRTDGRLCLNLTNAGKVVLQGTVFVALGALIVPAFGVLSALVSVVSMALLVGFILRPKIRISGNLPDRVISGQTIKLRYIIKNIGRLPSYNLCVRFRDLPETFEQAEDEHVISQLRPGESAEVFVSIRPKRRGHYQIKQPVCQSSFPFNFFRIGTSFNCAENLIVLPPFFRIQIPMKQLSRCVHHRGEKLAGRMGGSLEYAGNRPFIAGDSPRKIDSRAWARLSVPATKEYLDDFDNYTGLILDTRLYEVFTRSISNESKELEAAISLCASVAFSVNNSCLIDFLLAGPELYQLTDLPRMVRLDKIHEILAGIEPSKNYSLEQKMPIFANRFYEMSSVIFILLNWNESYIKLYELAGRAGCHGKVFLIKPSDEIKTDRYNASRTENIQLLSPDEILKGQIKHL